MPFQGVGVTDNFDDQGFLMTTVRGHPTPPKFQPFLTTLWVIIEGTQNMHVFLSCRERDHSRQKYPKLSRPPRHKRLLPAHAGDTALRGTRSSSSWLLLQGEITVSLGWTGGSGRPREPGPGPVPCLPEEANFQPADSQYGRGYIAEF